MNTIRLGKNIINGQRIINAGCQTSVFNFYILGTVDKQLSLLDGSVINITYVDITGFNTRIIFSVINSFSPYLCEKIAKNGSLGYIDFVNDIRNEISKEAASNFIWSEYLNCLL